MTWMQTHARRHVDLVEPDPRSIRLVDIAHALSRICRYNGHTSDHYSVAEHCVLIHDYLMTHAPEHALAGLLHDASEAYVGDLTYPMQLALGRDARSAVKAMHDRVWAAIVVRFDLEAVDIHHVRVKDADRRILLDECDAVLGGPIEPWAVDGPPLGVKVRCWHAEKAESEWTDRWMAHRIAKMKLSDDFLRGER